MDHKTTNGQFAAMLAITLIGLILRLIWVVQLPVNEGQLFRSLPDQREYLMLGRSLVAGDGLAFRDSRFDADVYAYRAPGYPAFIAACGGNIRVIRIAQSVIDSSTVIAIGLLARRWLSYRAAIVACLFTALNPFLIYFCGLLLAETLFICLLVWGMALAVRRVWFAGAVLLAIAVLVRPSAILLPTLIVALMPARRLAIPVAACMTLLVLFPWAWRNNRVLGSWIWTTTNGGTTLYDGFNPRATGASDQWFIQSISELRTMSEIQRSRYLTELAWEYVRHNPSHVVTLAVAKVARTWSPIPLSTEYGSDVRLVAIAACYSIPLFILTLMGVLAVPLPRAAKIILLLPAIYFTVAHAASIGSLRYRIPADVPMSVLAAGALERLIVHLRSARSHDVSHRQNS